MKKILAILLVTTFLLLAFTPTPVLAQDPQPGNTISGDQVIIGNTFRLESGETLDGSLLIIGGTASTAVDTAVNGDLVLIGGTLAINGSVDGDIVSIGGVVNLQDSAVVNGGLTMIGASLTRSPSAQISGSISEETPRFLDFDFLDENGLNLPFKPAVKPLNKILTAAFQSLVMAVLAVLVGLLLPRNLKNSVAALVREPVVNGGVGLLTVVVAPVILVLLTITIILIPVTLLAAIALGLAIVFGNIVVGYEIGNRLSAVFKDTWHPSIAAGIGTLLLSLVTGLAGVIPCVGWVLGFIASILGLGAVVTSRFGSTKYANKVVEAVISPIQPTAPGEEPPQQPPATPGI